MRGLLLPYLALVVIHLISNLQMEQPLVLADELGYLGNARYLAGTAPLPDMERRQFYHFGYSLFLLPAFWLFSDPVSIYRAALVINALLVSALYFPLFFILTSFVEAPGRTARWIAFACCLYPSLVLYSSFAWSESAFIPFYAVAAALFGRYLDSKTASGALLFGLAAGFLYTIHPRAVPVLAAVLLYLLLLAALRAVPARQVLLGATAMASVVALTWLVNRHLIAAGWAGAGEVSATRLAGRLLPGTDYPALIERALGQILYLSLASHGLFPVGLLAMAWLIGRGLASGSFREVLAKPATGVPVFLLTTAAGVFLASCTLKLYSLHGPAGLRGANFIHGRYNEAFAVFAIAYALAEYWRGPRPRQLALRVAVVALVVLSLTAVIMAEVDDALKRHAADIPGAEPRDRVLPSEVDAVAVPGVWPLVRLLGGLKLYPIALAVMASFTLITLMMRSTKRGGLAFLMLLFSFFSYYNHRHYLLPRMAGARPRLAFVSEVRRLGPIEAISYDFAHRERGFLPGIQYLLQDTVFRRFDSRKGELPTSEAVLSGDRWTQAGRLGARFVVSSGGGSALWLLPGEMQSRLPAPAWEGVTLGAEPRLGVPESGFYRTKSFLGAPGRWTRGAATLRVPLDPRNPPRRLRIETLAPGRRDGVRLRVLANGVELWHQRIPPTPWSKSFSLDEVPLDDELLIELESDTFTPADRRASGDKRRLGVVLRGIRLTARDGFE